MQSMNLLAHGPALNDEVRCSHVPDPPSVRRATSEAGREDDLLVLDHDRSCLVHSPFNLPEGVLPPTMIDAPWGTQPEHNQGFRVENPGRTGQKPGQFGQYFRKVPARTRNHPRHESSTSNLADRPHLGETARA